VTAGGILDGVRVVDMTQGVASAVATLMLAEAGADVVKVEPPGGDWTRQEPGFITWNRSKRSIVLDVSQPADVEVLHRLVAGADVLVHQETRASAEALGIDDAALAERHPRLVVCAQRRAPVGHPDEDRANDPVLAEASIGLLDAQGGARKGPIYLRYPLATYGTAYLMAGGILARLIHRARTGRGGAAHTSLHQGGLSQIMMRWSRATNPSPEMTPGPDKYRPTTLFECGDGVWLHVMSAVDDTPLMAKTLAELGPERCAELNAAETSTLAAAGRYPNLGANRFAFLQRPSQEWLDDLWANDCAVQAAVPPGVVFGDGQADVNGYVIDIDDPSRGPTRQVGVGFHVDPPARVQGAAPLLDADRDAILSSIADLSATSGIQLSNEGEGAGEKYPLEGIRVLDFGQFLAGPYAAMLLADLGADVIKIENPTGEPMRNPESVFVGCQRGKRAIALDLKSPDAPAVVEALVRTADVVHHNVRLPAARRLGIDYESLRSIKPDIVFAHVSNYGPAGPRADWPGFDQLAQSQCGWEVAGAGEGNSPMWHVFGMMDYQGALQSLIATLLALYTRFTIGAGQAVAGSILGGGLLTMSELHLEADGSLSPFPPLDHGLYGVSPTLRVFQAADGWVALAARTPAAAAAAVSAIGVDDVAALEAAVGSMKVDDALARWDAAGVPAERVREAQYGPFFDDDLNAELGLSVAYPHPVYGTLQQVGKLWDFGDLDVHLELPPPEVGEHTAPVLRGAAFDAEAIREMVERGAIRDNPGGRARPGFPPRIPS
jgi:crotonobetainyl-CoA:carnitine CoA-transferase CaiB-like acyl-CoA transferase